MCVHVSRSRAHFSKQYSFLPAWTFTGLPLSPKATSAMQKALFFYSVSSSHNFSQNAHPFFSFYRLNYLVKFLNTSSAQQSSLWILQAPSSYDFLAFRVWPFITWTCIFFIVPPLHPTYGLYLLSASEVRKSNENSPEVWFLQIYVDSQLWHQKLREPGQVTSELLYLSFLHAIKVMIRSLS